MLDKVHNYIKEHKMLEKGDRIVIGVSGGADSVCLFHVLYELKHIYDLTLFVVHINHGVRMEEADSDEQYVKDLCNRYQVSYEGIKVDVKALSKSSKLSEEETGRNVRYEAFKKSFYKNKCNKIAIAHNKNDNAETILFHMFRGSGLLGLTGIKPKRGNIIRPLLGIERQEIENYLNIRQISYCTDYTNQTDDYSRNRIRHHILSYAKENINTQAINNIVQSSNHIMEAEKYIEGKIAQAFNSLVEYNDLTYYKFNISRFIHEDIIIQKGVVRHILYLLSNSLKDVESIHVELVLSLLDKQVGKQVHLPSGIIAIKEYNSIVLQKLEGDTLQKEKEVIHREVVLDIETFPHFCMELPREGKFIEFKLLKWEKNMTIPQKSYTKWFDYDKIKNTVLVRTRAEGDYFHIDDMGNKKKLKTFFIDQKIPKEERDKQLLVCDGSHVMWVLGKRSSEGYRINEQTKVVLEISLNGGK